MATKIENLITPEIATVCFQAVRTVASSGRGGWTRLGFCLSSNGEKEYVLAIRKADNVVSFGCSCPDWIYRRRAAGEACKHLAGFLTGVGRPVRQTPAGSVFKRVLGAISDARQG